MMLKATIIYPKEQEISLFTELGKLGIIEIIPLKEETFKGFKREIPEEIHRINIFIDSLEKLANKVTETILVALGKDKIDLGDLFALPVKIDAKLYSLKELYDEYNEVYSFFSQFDDMKKLESELKMLNLLREIINRNPNLATELQKHLIFLETPEDEDPHIIEGNLKLIHVNFVHTKLKNKHIFVLINPPMDVVGAFLEALSIYNVTTLNIPIRQYSITDKESLERKISELSEKITDTKKQLMENLDRNLKKLAELYKKARITNKLMTAQTLTLKGNYTAILQGWVPQEEKDTLLATLTNKFKNIIISFDEPIEKEETPRKLVLSKRFSPWASLLLQMGYPSHEDLFPWILAGILWAFMFGYMFPDIGQGLTLIILGLLFAKTKKFGRSIERLLGFSGYKLGILLITAGIFSTLFGILFGDLFLIEIYSPIIPNIKEHWIQDATSIKWVIKYALVIGIAEILLAIFIYMLRSIKNHQPLEVIFGEWGIPGLLMFIGLTLTGLYFIGIKALLPPIKIGTLTIILSFPKKGMNVLNMGSPADSWPLYLFLLGLLLMLLGGKIEGNLGDKVPALIEVPLSIISNTLSFTRLAGFLIGHIAFGLMIEQFAELGGQSGFIGGFIAMNLLVMTLEVLVVSLQSLRLLLYEFSTKWYLGGGKIFRPFRLT